MTEIVFPTLFNNPKLTQMDPPEVPIFADDFQRANTSYPPVGGSLGSTPVGGFAWSRYWNNTPAQYGGMIIDGAAGIAAEVSSGSTRTGVTVNTPDVFDGIFRATFKSGEKSVNTHLVFRFVDVNNFLFMSITNNHWALYKRVAGSGILQAERSDRLATNGDQIVIECSGTNIDVNVAGVQWGTKVVPEFATATRWGFGNTMPIGVTSTPICLWEDISLHQRGSWSD